MTSRIIVTPVFDLIVFGATGDLAARKLFPALYRRDVAGQIAGESRIFGVSRHALDSAEFRSWIARAIADFVPASEISQDSLDRFLQRTAALCIDVSSDSGWEGLAAALDSQPERIRAFYLAVGPDLVEPICRNLGKNSLATKQSRVVIEKPLGKNGREAQAINLAVGAVFSESQIFRIDHYLGKETVQNLMALRFANMLFEPLWNSNHIDHVQITVAETLGVESRAGYYDSSGALRDMVQNHLLQLLCLVAMEPPLSDHGDDLRDEKLKILRALKPIHRTELEQVTVRGQYRSGVLGQAAVPGYLEELGRESSDTETFVALKAEVLNWRWSGTPFYLRSGKRLAQRASEIVVSFRPVPHQIFDQGVGKIHANRLVIRLQPDEGVKLWLMIKDPGPGGMRLTYIPLDMSFADAFGVAVPDAYERLLMDVVRGSQTLFMRRDEVDAAWHWIDPILDGWKSEAIAVKPYVAGSWGPSAAVALIERDGRSWHEEE
ncbi:MAG: glucose-6-phosphate dehydrogenase [Alphaproteobacteria bacterium]|nr:glucose-6-phosphate dehydrogenase [Alphaproteobacteria bacterium]